MRGAPSGVGAREKVGGRVVEGEGGGVEGGGVGGEVRGLGPGGRRKGRWVCGGEAEEEVVGEGAEAAEVVDGEREEVDAVGVEKVGVRDREFCAGPVVVCSECGFRMG